MGNRRLKSPDIIQGTKVRVKEEQLRPEQQIDYPVFCFKHLHPEYSVECCDKDERSALLVQLSKLSKMKWTEIQLAGKHGLGSEKIDKRSLKARVPDFISEDVDFLLAFRFHKKMPFLGHRNGAILHLIYIDPKGAVYDHE